MATIDITAHMIPSRYGESDQWITADEYNRDLRPGGEWIQLRMKCRYTRRVERFSVLYQGPGGKMRLEHGGPQVSGPIGSFIAQASVIANTPVAKARYLDVEAGDVLIINGQRMVILDDQPYGYPRIVGEAEAGLAAAVALVRAQLTASFQRQPGTVEDNARSNERQAVLTSLIRQLNALAEELRQRYATPAVR